MAEREGFEPPIRFPVFQFSRLAPSTTRPSLRRLQFYYSRAVSQETGRDYLVSIDSEGTHFATHEPATASTEDARGRPPSDAVRLFDGKDLSGGAGADGQAAKWKVADGYMEVVPHSGYIHTRRPFGDCQLHVEFAEPVPPVGESQGRGNSGVFLMGLYEIQVLDSYQNKTYADGQAAGVYGQFPPQVNASLPPGQWQTYDIIFHGPRFDQEASCCARRV